jgi:hypothetical protein
MNSESRKGKGEAGVIYSVSHDGDSEEIVGKLNLRAFE